MADADRYPKVTENPKKRQKLGRKRERERDERLTGHKTGPSCECKRLLCFEVTTEEEREVLINTINGLKNKDQQDSLLSSLVSVEKIKQRRLRNDENTAALHNNAYTYSLRLTRDDSAVTIPVCFNAFLAMFGVTKSRVERIRASLATSGYAPIDKRGKHTNRPHAFTDDQVQRIIDHISSFKGRKSHYSLKDSRKLYLSQDLNLRKMFDLYTECNPDHKCSLESYRKIFTEKFNIGFGYPRKDTCSICDRFNIQLKSTDLTAPEIAQLDINKELHLRKAQVFYDRKSHARQEAQTTNTCTALAFDFSKNLSSPNISTNDVYYHRQLSLYSFNIHRLEDDSVHFFCYDETVAKKGADEVASMLYFYFTNILPEDIKSVQLFCDSCAGQNKNWTVVRFLHYMVVHRKRFENLKISFPIRGHSYMECDRDMAVVNQKAQVETPKGWMEEFRKARIKPTPFTVIDTEQDSFLNITECIKHLYCALCPVPTRPLREICFSQNHPRMFHYRECWNGPFSSAVISKPVGPRTAARLQRFKPSCTDRLPISAAKYADLQILKEFCSLETQQYFTDLPYSGRTVQGGAGSPDHSDESESDYPSSD